MLTRVAKSPSYLFLIFIGLVVSPVFAQQSNVQKVSAFYLAQGSSAALEPGQLNPPAAPNLGNALPSVDLDSVNPATGSVPGASQPPRSPDGFQSANHPIFDSGPSAAGEPEPAAAVPTPQPVPTSAEYVPTPGYAMAPEVTSPAQPQSTLSPVEASTPQIVLAQPTTSGPISLETGGGCSGGGCSAGGCSGGGVSSGGAGAYYVVMPPASGGCSSGGCSSAPAMSAPAVTVGPACGCAKCRCHHKKCRAKCPCETSVVMEALPASELSGCGCGCCGLKCGWGGKCGCGGKCFFGEFLADLHKLKQECCGCGSKPMGGLLGKIFDKKHCGCGGCGCRGKILGGGCGHGCGGTCVSDVAVCQSCSSAPAPMASPVYEVAPAPTPASSCGCSGCSSAPATAAPSAVYQVLPAPAPSRGCSSCSGG